MKEVARYADEAMYTAAPIEEVRPRVTLIDMTADPLRVMAAAAELYQGGIYPYPADITQEQAMTWLDGFKRSKISAPLEWISLSFFIEGVTRAFTHQLVRQRTAVYVQESLRFAVKENAGMEVMMPPSVTEMPEDAPARKVWEDTVSRIAWAYNALIDCGVPAEDARGLLPTNITTRIHYHTNLRNLVDHAGLRLCSQAQYEWKQVWAEMIRAILAYGPPSERWQQKAISSLFAPVCYQTGKCEFMGPADRWCVIRDRVEAHHARGERPDTWSDINPHEPLHPESARRA
jgi:flavin-dependent thymidylate synthase